MTSIVKTIERNGLIINLGRSKYGIKSAWTTVDGVCYTYCLFHWFVDQVDKDDTNRTYEFPRWIKTELELALDEWQGNDYKVTPKIRHHPSDELLSERLMSTEPIPFIRPERIVESHSSSSSKEPIMFIHPPPIKLSKTSLPKPVEHSVPIYEPKEEKKDQASVHKLEFEIQKCHEEYQKSLFEERKKMIELAILGVVAVDVIGGAYAAYRSLPRERVNHTPRIEVAPLSRSDLRAKKKANKEKYRALGQR